MPACPSLPRVIGHRGAAASAPENTLAGLRRAHRLGCRWVEFDVRLSGDGGLVLCHDARVDRTTDGTGRLRALSLAELRRLDAGGWFAPGFAGETMPSLAEALALCGALGLGANIEIKADRGLARATAAAVASAVACISAGIAADASRKSLSARPPCAPSPARGGVPGWGAQPAPILVSSFHQDALEELHLCRPDIATGLLLKSVPRGWRELAQTLDCATINVSHAALRPGLVEDIGAAGYPVLAYTVNDAARAATLFGWGVTSVFSDEPDIILAMIASRCGTRSHPEASLPVSPPQREDFR